MRTQENAGERRRTDNAGDWVYSRRQGSDKIQKGGSGARPARAERIGEDGRVTSSQRRPGQGGLGGEVGMGLIGEQSQKSPCQFLEGCLAVMAWDDLLG